MDTKRKINRRQFLRNTAAIIGATSAVSFLNACVPAPTPAVAPGAPAAPAEKPPTAKAAGAVVDIAFWQHYGGDSRPKLSIQLATEYKQQHPNINVHYETIPVAEFDKKLIASLAGGSGPDMTSIGDWSFALFDSKGWLSPADPAWFDTSDLKGLVDLYLPRALDGLIFKDKLYGIPNEYNVLHNYYRADQFKEVGLDPKNPPKTWTDMGEYGAKLTVRDASGKVTRAGFQWPYRPPMDPTWPGKYWHAVIYGLGGDILSADGTKCIMNSPEGEKAGPLILDFIDKYKCSEPGYTLNDKNPEFWQGRSSMDLEGPWGAGLGKATNPDLYAKYGDGWAITNMPQWPAADLKRRVSPMWRYGWVVNAATTKQADCWAFINFMSQARLRWFWDVGDIPARKGWENDPSLKDAPWLPIQLKDYADAVPFPAPATFFQIIEQINQGLERFIADRGKIKESLDTAAAAIDEILKNG
jgi:multiple sugar transport system substrate-binding protein